MLPFRSLRRLLVVVLTALLAAVLLPYAASQAVPHADPKVGDCHTYTFDQGLKNHETSAPSNCNQDHTARVIAVHDIPADKSWSDLSKSDLLKLTARYCYPKFWDALGRTHQVRDQSSYVMYWFIPTHDQQDAGARWLRCDLDLSGGKTLLTLPTDDEPALPSGALPDSISRCLTGQGYTTTCDRSHAYRSVGAFTMHVKSYPGPKKAERIAVQHCGRFVTTRSWWYTYRSLGAFRQGDHVMVCFNKSKH